METPERKLKKGDIVQFTPEAAKQTWYRKLTGPDQAFEICGPRARVPDRSFKEYCWPIRRLNGKPVGWDNEWCRQWPQLIRHVGARWLVKDEFLTAVRRAKNKAAAK